MNDFISSDLVFIAITGFATIFIGVYVAYLVRALSRQQQSIAQNMLRSEAYAKAIVDTAAEAIISIGSSGRIETFNHAAQTMFGYNPNQVLGKNVSMLMPDPFASEHDHYITRYQETGNPRVIGVGREVSGKHKDGSVFPIHLSVSEVFHQSERKFVGLIYDLSAQRDVEKELQESRSRLVHFDRLNSLGYMAAGIAHEVNQPLSAISLFAKSGIHLLDDDIQDPERMRVPLEKIREQAQRAGAIIKNIQQLARQRESQRALVDCNELLEGVLQLSGTEAQTREMRIRLDLFREPLLVHCDAVQIQQVALNLVRNAMDSMESIDQEHGNVVTISSGKYGNVAMISVIDSGLGISQEVEEMLFTQFSTTKRDSMGMGLSISQNIIKDHGGKIGFENNTRAGSTFWFTLPLYREEDSGTE